jgi:photosystem II stability/assembly factor-like uncharacterized protein
MNGEIIFTSNKGEDWISLSSGTDNNLNCVYFTSPDNGWVVGENGTILNTTNKGLKWDLQSSGVTSELNKIVFTSDFRSLDS